MSLEADFSAVSNMPKRPLAWVASLFERKLHELSSFDENSASDFLTPDPGKMCRSSYYLKRGEVERLDVLTTAAKSRALNIAAHFGVDENTLYETISDQCAFGLLAFTLKTGDECAAEKIIEAKPYLYECPMDGKAKRYLKHAILPFEAYADAVRDMICDVARMCDKDNAQSHIEKIIGDMSEEDQYFLIYHATEPMSLRREIVKTNYGLVLTNSAKIPASLKKIQKNGFYSIHKDPALGCIWDDFVETVYDVIGNEESDAQKDQKLLCEKIYGCMNAVYNIPVIKIEFSEEKGKICQSIDVHYNGKDFKDSMKHTIYADHYRPWEKDNKLEFVRGVFHEVGHVMQEMIRHECDRDETFMEISHYLRLYKEANALAINVARKSKLSMNVGPMEPSKDLGRAAYDAAFVERHANMFSTFMHDNLSQSLRGITAEPRSLEP